MKKAKKLKTSLIFPAVCICTGDPGRWPGSGEFRCCPEMTPEKKSLKKREKS
ncbi:MAG: hypothetical protein IKD44_08630 [Lentisphaeria bacterium]|nr:hypothetical protein [Lentisphaeria bacterium]